MRTNRPLSGRFLSVLILPLFGALILLGAGGNMPANATPSTPPLGLALVTDLGAGPPLTPGQAHLTLYPSPPPGFRPLSATSAQLSEYGFPQRPRGNATNWRNALNDWRSRLTDPTIRVLKNRPGLSANDRTSSIGGNKGYYDTGYAGNANGQIAYQPNGYYQVQAGWTVPSVTPTAVNSYSSIWPGIGAYASLNHLPNDTLVQAGTEQDYINGSGSTYYAWYEACCNTDPYQNMVSNFAVHPGDRMFINITLLVSNQDAAYSTMVGYDIENLTTGQDFPMVESFGPPSGGDAEFIVERTCVYNNCDPMLADFSPIMLTGTNWGIQFPNNPPYSEYSGACVGQDFHFDPHMATSTPVPPGIPVADPEAFTDPYGCNFPVLRVNPSY
jgi:hypothetical protein